jgi:P4 family phage/plasmid primase-like protien
MLIQESGISPGVVYERGYSTVTDPKELLAIGFSERQSKLVPALLLPMHAATGGVVLHQLRPNDPWFDRRKKPPKYLKYETPRGEHLRLDIHPRCQPDIGNPSIDLWITEGLKKVDKLVSEGCCVVGLIGVDAWSGSNEHRGKVALPDWRDIALNGRLIRIVYDSDVMEKREVHRALKDLKAYLEYKKARVEIVYLPTLPDLDKVGVDDYLVRGHSIDDLIQLSSGELRAPEGQEEGGMEVRQSKCVEHLTGAYAGTLLFASERAKWFAYGSTTPGVWSAIEDEQMQNRLRRDLAGLQPKGFSWSFLQGCERMLRAALGRPLKRLPAHMIPFQNGILDTTTMKVVSHTPERLSTWCVPYDYDEKATCEPVQDWMKEMLGEQKDLYEVLRAYLRAILLSRTGIQKFLELLGPGGTGKSTFINIATALVGYENMAPTKLSLLESSRFEAAKLAGKRLIVITDAERYGGEVTVLKALTGQDHVPWEEKNNRRLGSFVAEGMVIVAANQPIQSADYTSGLERRRLTIYFNTEPNEPRTLIEFKDGKPVGEFVEYLPGVVNWALSMSESDMLRMLDRAGQSAPSIISTKAKIIIETNPVAAWANETLIHEPNATTYVGVRKVLEFGRGYADAAIKLFPSYLSYVDAHGHQPTSSVTFSGRLEDLCKSQLKLEGVYRHRDAAGNHFNGIRIRKGSDKDDCLIEQALHVIAKRAVQGDVGPMLGQVIDNVEDAGNAGFLQTSVEEKEEERKEASPFPSFSFPAIEDKFEAKNPAFPASPTLATTYSDDNPSQPSIPSIGPQLPMGGGGACPNCKGRKLKHSVSDSMCMACGHRFEAGYRL